MFHSFGYGSSLTLLFQFQPHTHTHKRPPNNLYRQSIAVLVAMVAVVMAMAAPVAMILNHVMLACSVKCVLLAIKTGSTHGRQWRWWWCGGGQGLTINQSSGRDGKVVKLVSRLQSWQLLSRRHVQSGCIICRMIMLRWQPLLPIAHVNWKLCHG